MPSPRVSSITTTSNACQSCPNTEVRAVFNLPAYSEEAAALQTVPFYEGDLSLYREFVHPAGWQRDQVRRFLAREFRKPASIRTILNNDPPFFTSNHAAFFAR